MKIFDQARKIRRLLTPFSGHACGAFPEFSNIHLFRSGERRLESIPASHVLINMIPAIHPSEWYVRKVPLAGVEAIALVHERDIPGSACCPFVKDRLTPIGVASPLIQHKNTREIEFIANPGEHRLRQILADEIASKVRRIT